MLLAVARHSFSPARNSRWPARPSNRRPPAGILQWLDAQGGLYQGKRPGHLTRARSLRCRAEAGRAAALLHSREDPQEPARWTLIELDPAEGYAGALAVEGRDGACATITGLGLVHHSPAKRPDTQDEEDDDRDAQPQQHPADIEPGQADDARNHRAAQALVRVG